MATQPHDRRRRELEEEYTAWARICENKHGLPWPIPQDELSDIPTQDLLNEIKRLRNLGRTPPE